MIILHPVEPENNSSRAQSHASTSTQMSQSRIPTTSHSTAARPSASATATHAASVPLSEHHLRDMSTGLTSEHPEEHQPHQQHQQHQQSSTSTSYGQMHSSIPLNSQQQGHSASSYGRPRLSAVSSSGSHIHAPVSGHGMSSGTYASHGPPEHLHQSHDDVHPASSAQPSSSYPTHASVQDIPGVTSSATTRQTTFGTGYPSTTPTVESNTSTMTTVVETPVGYTGPLPQLHDGESVIWVKRTLTTQEFYDSDGGADGVVEVDEFGIPIHHEDLPHHLSQQQQQQSQPQQQEYQQRGEPAR